MRKPDAYVGHTATGATLVLRPDHSPQWAETRATLQPAYIRTPEDRETLLKGAAFIEDYASSAVHYELAKRLREMAGS